MKQFKDCFIWTFIVGIIAHGFCFFNTMSNHDSIMIYMVDDAWKASLGRYMVVPYRMLRTRYSVPWLNGMLSLLFVSLVAYMIVAVFKLENKLEIVAVCAVLATLRSFTVLNAVYIHDSDSYMFAMALSAFAGAVIVCNVFKKQYINIIVSALALMGAIGIYQAYVFIPALIIGTYLLMMSLRNEQIKSMVSIAINTIISYAVCAVAYIVGTKVVLKIMGVELSTGQHNSIDQVMSLKEIHVFSGVVKAYKLFINDFFSVARVLNIQMLIINIVIMALVCALVAIIICKKKLDVVHAVIAVLIVLAYPLLYNGINIVAAQGILMKGGYFMYYVLPVILISFIVKENLLSKEYFKKAVVILAGVCLVGTVFYEVVVSNAIYLKKNLDYQSTIALLNRVIYDVEKVDGYTVGETEVAFIGTPVDSQYTKDRLGYTFLEKELDFNYSVTGYYTYSYFINQILNMPMNIKGDWEAYEMSQLDEVKSMPDYPASGSVKMIDDVVVVKINENFH